MVHVRYVLLVLALWMPACGLPDSGQIRSLADQLRGMADEVERTADAADAAKATADAAREAAGAGLTLAESGGLTTVGMLALHVLRNMTRRRELEHVARGDGGAS